MLKLLFASFAALFWPLVIGELMSWSNSIKGDGLKDLFVYAASGASWAHRILLTIVVLLATAAAGWGWDMAHRLMFTPDYGTPQTHAVRGPDQPCATADLLHGSFAGSLADRTLAILEIKEVRPTAFGASIDYQLKLGGDSYQNGKGFFYAKNCSFASEHLPSDAWFVKTDSALQLVAVEPAWTFERKP